jgi:hypothetical protein
MNIYDLTQYVNQDVDDTFEVESVVRWFNKGIAQYNLLSPITTYPFAYYEDAVEDGEEGAAWSGTGPYPSHSSVEYPLDDTFMLGVILPFISASVRGQESSLGEKQMFMAEYMSNASLFKTASNVPYEFLKIKTSRDLEKYQIGENVYISDMSISPWAGDWGHNTTTMREFKESLVAEFYNGTGQSVTITTPRVTFTSGERLSAVAARAGISGSNGLFYQETSMLNTIIGDTELTSPIIVYLRGV